MNPNNLSEMSIVRRFALFFIVLSLPSLYAQNQSHMWIEIDQGGWGDKIIFSRYGVIVSAFNYHGDLRRQFYNTTYYPPSKLDKCSIDSLFEYLNTHYQHSKCKEFTTNKVLTLDGGWTEIYMQNGRYVNTMGTTVDCFSKEMDIIERMANRILDELSDSNNIYTGGYVEDCDIAETSPFCYLNTLEGSSFRDFFCQFYVDDELLFTICQSVGLMYEDGQACFIPEYPDHVKKQYSINWAKLLYRMRNDLRQCQSDTIPGMNGNYLLVRFNGQWSYVNGLDMKTLKGWLKMMERVVPISYRKSFRGKKKTINPVVGKEITEKFLSSRHDPHRHIPASLPSLRQRLLSVLLQWAKGINFAALFAYLDV